MSNCTIADVEALVLGPGVRFAHAEHARAQEAIDAAAVDVAADGDDVGTLVFSQHEKYVLPSAAGQHCWPTPNPSATPFS